MQKVGKQERIRYCGSLIPLSFSEITDKKGVIIADVTPENGLSKVREVAAPVFRRLTTLKGTMTQVEEKLIQNHRPDDPLPAWLEIVVTGEPGIAAPDRRLRELAQDLHLEILKIKIERGAHTWTEAAPTEDLSYLSPEEVFEQRCIAKGLSPEETERMKAEFGDLKNWMQENW
jgi:exonuclease SbcD